MSELAVRRQRPTTLLREIVLLGATLLLTVVVIAAAVGLPVVLWSLGGICVGAFIALRGG